MFGIVAGLVAVGGLLAGTSFRTWTALFLGTTVFTSVSGFGFPSTGAVSPAQVSSDTHMENNYEWTDNMLVFDVVNFDHPVFIGTNWLQGSFDVSRSRGEGEAA